MFKMDKITFKGKEVSFGIFNKVAYVNTTPHNINFGVNEVVTVLSTSGLLVNAIPTEELVKAGKINFIKTSFQKEDEVGDFLTALALLIINQTSVEDVVFVGSIIAAQAYPGVIVALTPCKGYERVAPQEKRMNIDKFTIF